MTAPAASHLCTVDGWAVYDTTDGTLFRVHEISGQTVDIPLAPDSPISVRGLQTMAVMGWPRLGAEQTHYSPLQVAFFNTQGSAFA